MLRRFVCDACGKNIEVNWCTNQRGRDLRCPECGGLVYRESGVETRQGCRRDSINILTADKKSVNNVRTDENVFDFRQRHAKNGSGRCLGNGNGLSRRRSG